MIKKRRDSLKKTIKKDNYRLIKRPIPLVSEVQLDNKRKEINATNRSRSKSHERRVAVLLHGNRIPMSGAMKGYKGDVIVPFINNPGNYLIECKLTAQIDNARGGNLMIKLSWFEKLLNEVEDTLGCKFGVFVFHYHNHSILQDYVLIREQDAIMIANKYPSHMSDTVLQLATTVPYIDIRTMNGRPRKVYNVNETTIGQAMMQKNGINSAGLHTPYGKYLIFYLQDFKDFIASA